MRKFGTTVLTVLLAGSMIVTPVFAEPSVDDLKQSKQAAEEQVSSLQGQLTSLMSELGDLEEKLIAKGDEISKATEDLAAAEAKEKEQYEAMKLRIKYLYEQGDTSEVEALVTAENFGDLVSKAEYSNNIHKYDRKKLEEYVDTKEKIEKLRTQLEDDQKKLETMQAEAEAKEAELSSTIETKQAEVADFDQQIQAAAEAAAAAAEAQRQQEEARQAQAAQSDGGSSRGGSDDGGTAINTGGSDLSYTGTGNTATAQAIVDAAYSQLGVPYVWGGSSPGSGLDCSGLTQYCHSVAGIGIARTSEVQGGGGKAVSNPQPGDLVCYGHHIGIYIGNGQMIHAPHTGDVVRVASVYGSPWYRRYW